MTRLAKYYQEHAEKQHPGDLPKDLIGLTSITENGGDDTSSSPAAAEHSPEQPETPETNAEPSNDPAEAKSETPTDKETASKSVSNQPEVSSNGVSGGQTAASAPSGIAGHSRVWSSAFWQGWRGD